ncbi:MAG: hypothetical protein GXP27_14285, partial [Planctomycetes bacterium]|nr:hypothetical protein [Planctomycetota bacterium]
LPVRPTNLYRLTWSANGYPSDTKGFRITASRQAGQAPDPTNVLGTVNWIGNGNYSFNIPARAINRSGQWQFDITPFDDAHPNGNPGTAARVTINAQVYPPDVLRLSDGQRFDINESGGIAIVSFTYPTL